LARNQRIYCLTTTGDKLRAVCLQKGTQEPVYELVWAEDLGGPGTAGQPDLIPAGSHDGDPDTTPVSQLNSEPDDSHDGQSDSMNDSELGDTSGGGSDNREIWQELARNSDTLTVLIPGGLVDLMQTPLPPLKRSEIESAVLGLVKKEKGPGHEDWIASHQQLATGAEGRGGEQQICNILYMNREELQTPLTRFARWKVRPTTLIPGAVALDAMYRRQLDLTDDTDEVTAWTLVHLDREECFLVIGDRRGPLMIRPLPTDLSDGDDTDEYLGRLSTEIERSTFFAQRGQVPVQVNRIVIAGDPRYADPLLRKLDDFETRRERWRPEKNISVPDNINPWDLILTLAGATYPETADRFSLMPARPEDSIGWRTRRLAAVALVAVAVCSLPTIFIVSHLLKQSQERVITTQTEQLEHSRNAVRLAAKTYLRDTRLLTRQDWLEDLGPGRANLSGFLRDLSLRTPGSIELLAMNVERAGQGYRIKIRGQCEEDGSEKAQREFIQFRESLRRSPYLRTDREPSFLEISVAEQTATGNSVVSFTLEYRIREVRSDS
jgi:hypothetical protein